MEKPSRRPKLRPILPPPPSTVQQNVMSPFSPIGPSIGSSVQPMSIASNLSAKVGDQDLSRNDPDELFTRYTISEIRAIQTRLRADADAKQEELRLMVGERYRDLLQASSSIISIADSSKQVVDTLHRMETACSAEDGRESSRHQPEKSKDDAQLQTLRSLSAHLKLLLDTPEHIWRLLERKKYLDAAWLFLLARVVYRTLVGEDAEDWESEGIDVLEQFPLVQRQWDSVSQLRSQISHKATLSLRDASASTNDILHTLLSLIILDSISLVESLSLFLLQRNRTLQAFLSQHPAAPKSPTKSTRRRSYDMFSEASRRYVVKEVKEPLIRVLRLVDDTLSASRLIFGSQMASLIGEIQADVPTVPVNTPQLLATLPSAPLLTPYLPSTVQAYTPYIDPALHIHISVLTDRTASWFDAALQSLEPRLDAWLTGLTSAAEVEQVRRGLLDQGTLKGLNADEITKAEGVVDSACLKRVIEIWKQSLENLDILVSTSLNKALETMRNGETDSQQDSSPLGYRFSSNLPYPPSQSASSNLASSFKQFKTALRQRVTNRTPLLDSVLQALEEKSKQLRVDLDIFDGTGQDSSLQRELIQEYRPIAQACCQRISESMHKFLSTYDDSSIAVVFLGRIAHELSSASNFIADLDCSEHASTEFRESLKHLHDLSLEKWKSNAVETALRSCKDVFTSFDRRLYITTEDVPIPSRPSPELMTSLLSLISSLQQLGLSRDYLESKSIVEHTVTDFTNALVDMCSKKSTATIPWSRESAQVLWDLTFLGKLLDILLSKNGSLFNSTTESYNTRLLRFKNQVSSPDGLADQLVKKDSESITKQFLRTQLLLGPLIGLGSSASSVVFSDGAGGGSSTAAGSSLLKFGVPIVDQEFLPAMDLAKPGPRFGLLLVGGTTGR